MFKFQGFELRKIARSARTRSINARQAATGNGQQHEMFSTVPASVIFTWTDSLVGHDAERILFSV